MRYILILLLLLTTGCDIESAIDNAGQRCANASQRCEDEIAKIIENIEASCITKDELLDIIDSVRTQNDQNPDYDVGNENKDSLDEAG
jgi:hypothetical protein